jgi:hypothetical protein
MQTTIILLGTIFYVMGSKLSSRRGRWGLFGPVVIDTKSSHYAFSGGTAELLSERGSI